MSRPQQDISSSADEPIRSKTGCITRCMVVGIAISYSIVVLPGGHGIALAGLIFLFPLDVTDASAPLTWGGIAALVCALFSKSRGVTSNMNALGTTSLLFAWVDLVIATDPQDRDITLASSVPFIMTIRFFDFWSARACGPRGRRDWQYSLRELALTVVVAAAYALPASLLFGS